MNDLLEHQRAFTEWRTETCVSTSRSRIDAESFTFHTLRRAYPNHHVTRTAPSHCDLLGFAAAGHADATKCSVQDATRVYRTAESRLNGQTGSLQDVVNLCRWDYSYHGIAFIVYEEAYTSRFSQNIKRLYVLVPEHEDGRGLDTLKNNDVDALLLAAGRWTNEPHEECWTFDNPQWFKSKAVWQVMRGVDWSHIVLPASLKTAINRDVHGFFLGKSLFKNMGLPWKRGIILHGPPGNGKSMVTKAIMNSLATATPAIPSMYVKSLDACQGLKWSLQQIFSKARRIAPCLLVLEDLDSLVADQTRTYFLNEVDGLDYNDGILLVGTTNNLEELDPAVSKRPSRFDRHYKFPLPDYNERLDYRRLQRHVYTSTANHLDFPQDWCDSIAAWTEGFSFAYPKELFITCLLLQTVDSGQKHKEKGAEHCVTSCKPSEKQINGQKHSRETLSPDSSLVSIFETQAGILREQMGDAAQRRQSSKVPSAPPPLRPSLASTLDDEY